VARCATGLGNKQIAGQLGISVNTVKVYLRSVYRKAGVRAWGRVSPQQRIGLFQTLY
jgi:DNA-binding NarL/FixJ family response regulator